MLFILPLPPTHTPLVETSKGGPTGDMGMTQEDSGIDSISPPGQSHILHRWTMSWVEGVWHSFYLCIVCFCGLVPIVGLSACGKPENEAKLCQTHTAMLTFSLLQFYLLTSVWVHASERAMATNYTLHSNTQDLKVVQVIKRQSWTLLLAQLPLRNLVSHTYFTGEVDVPSPWAKGAWCNTLQTALCIPLSSSLLYTQMWLTYAPPYQPLNISNLTHPLTH